MTVTLNVFIIIFFYIYLEFTLVYMYQPFYSPAPIEIQSNHSKSLLPFSVHYFRDSKLWIFGFSGSKWTHSHQDSIAFSPPCSRPLMNWTTVPLILWLQRQLSMWCHFSAAVSASHMTLSFPGPHVLQSHAHIVLCAQCGSQNRATLVTPNTEDRKCNDGIAVRFLFITCLR